ncbi:hypothetical protein PMAYCL1PPCAC_13910, partial [Pristionchus mayeri]
ESRRDLRAVVDGLLPARPTGHLCLPLVQTQKRARDRGAQARGGASPPEAGHDPLRAAQVRRRSGRAHPLRTQWNHLRRLSRPLLLRTRRTLRNPRWPRRDARPRNDGRQGSERRVGHLRGSGTVVCWGYEGRRARVGRRVGVLLQVQVPDCRQAGQGGEREDCLPRGRDEQDPGLGDSRQGEE